jgi:hypothetical protein
MSGLRAQPEQLPPLDGFQTRLLPIADLFMALMLSRPPSGSLRTTRVTAATIWLAAATSVLVGIPGVLLMGFAIFRPNALLLLIGLMAACLGLGSTSLAVFGIRQRQARTARAGR